MGWDFLSLKVKSNGLKIVIALTIPIIILLASFAIAIAYEKSSTFGRIQSSLTTGVTSDIKKQKFGGGGYLGFEIYHIL